MKKKILGIFLLMAGVVTLTSCYDDNDSLQDKANLTVSKAEIVFQPGGGTGTVTVRSATAYTVTSSTDWCTVSTSGNTITVETPEYDELESRYSKLTIKAGTEETTVAVHQYGLIFALQDGPTGRLIKGDDAFTATYAMSTNADLNFTTTADWLSVKVTEDADGNKSLSIIGEENTTGKFRQGEVNYTFKDFEGSITVLQGSVENDLLGNWEIYGYNPAGSQIIGFEGVLYETADLAKTTNTYSDYTLRLDMGDGENFLDLPIHLDEETLTVSVKMGNYMGDYLNYHWWTMGWDGSAGYITWQTTVGMQGDLEYDSDYDTMWTQLEDDGKWGSYEITLLRFNAFNSTTEATSANRQTQYLAAMWYPVLEKVDNATDDDDDDDEATPRMISKAKRIR